MGFESIDQPGRSSEVEHNPKTSISSFWLERGGRWGLSTSTSLADHQKMNVIQKQAFHFLAGEGWQMGFKSTNQPSRSSEVERNPKLSILFFDDLGGLFLHFSPLLLLGSLGQSSEVERNIKMSFSFFDDLGGLSSHFDCQEVMKRLNRIVLGLKLVEHKSEKPKFLSDPNSYLSIQERGGIEKIQTETTEDPN